MSGAGRAQAGIYKKSDSYNELAPDFYPVIADGMWTIYLHKLNKKFNSKFHKDLRVYWDAL